MARLVFKKQGGFVLVELLVVLVLIGTVLGLGYLYFDFGTTTFTRGERQSIAQQSIRLSADFITSEIRYANQVTINPTGMPLGYHYIYQYSDSVIYRDRSGNERVLSDSSADNIAYSVSFSEESTIQMIDFELVILFTLEAEDDLYSLDTSVYVLNLSDSDSYSDLSEVDEVATVIQYRKPFD